MFESILGHQRQLAVLAEDIRLDRLSHAYLFEGPEEVGKSTVALSFVSQVLAGHDFSCKDSSCVVCRDLRAGEGQQVSLFWDNAESIKVEDVRRLIEKLQLKPPKGMYFCVIENVERMTLAAANAFLKVLEEPVQGVIFVLLSVHVKRVLPTVLSRVRKLRFSDVGEEVLKQYLADREIIPSEIENILRLSGGKVGLVMKLMERANLLERYTQLYEQIVGLIERGDLIDRFLFCEKIAKDEDDRRLLSDTLRLMAIYFREAGVARYAGALRAISGSKHLLLTTNVNKRMLMERLFLQMEEDPSHENEEFDGRVVQAVRV